MSELLEKPRKRNWSRVGSGLDFELAGAGVLSISPALFLLLWQYQLDVRWGIAILTIATSLSCLGRCLCLATPTLPRYPGIFSVITSFFGIVSLAAFASDGTWMGAGIGIGAAFCLQWISTALFVQTLEILGQDFGAPEILELTSQLGSRLSQCLLAIGRLFLATFVVGALVVIYSLITWGLGIILAIPIGLLVLSPFIAHMVSIEMSLMMTYAKTLYSLRSLLKVQET